MDAEQKALFTLEVPELARPKERPRGTGKPRWSKYHPVKPVKCDDCLRIQWELQGNGPLARFARWKRVQGSTDRLLCTGHAQQWREDDKLPELADAAAVPTEPVRRPKAAS